MSTVNPDIDLAAARLAPLAVGDHFRSNDDGFEGTVVEVADGGYRFDCGTRMAHWYIAEEFEGGGGEILRRTPIPADWIAPTVDASTAFVLGIAPETAGLKITEDGFLVNEDGEIVGLAHDAAMLTMNVEANAIQSAKPFAVTDVKGAEWVLRKLMDAEASLAAIEHRPDVVAARALLANVDALKKPILGKIEWLHARFDVELLAWAKTALVRGRKYAQTAYGRVSVKTIKEGIKLRDGKGATERNAVAWAKEHAPNAVETTTLEVFRVSELTDEERTRAIARWKELHAIIVAEGDKSAAQIFDRDDVALYEAFAVTEAGERPEIATGV